MSISSESGLRGRIFNLVRGSYVDGPGIRTTVFLKGCPLRCLWCCNVEGQLAVPEVKLTKNLCNSCGECLPVCPRGAISLEGGIHVDRALCDGCGECMKICYTGAIEPFDRVMTVEEVAQIALRDVAFYRQTGGGVSIGGGEPSMQADFALELIRRLKEEGVHVALDTCGYTVSDRALDCLKEADLLLFDIKGLNDENHIRNTGVSNERILKNFRIMADMGKPMLVRMPLIPGLNDSEEELRAAAELLAGAPSVQRVDVMAYHVFGITKYGQLEREYPLPQEPMSDERAQEIASLLKSYGLNVHMGG